MTFISKNNKLYLKSNNKLGDPITSFDYVIEHDKEYIEVDGKSTHFYQLKVTNELGETLAPLTISSEVYDTGKWTSSLGSQVAVYNQPAFKKVLPKKLCDTSTKRTTVYRFVGVFTLKGSYCYVDNNGIITDEGYNPNIKADMPGKLSLFCLPAPAKDKEELKFAIRAVLELESLTPNNAYVGILAKVAAVRAIISKFIPNSSALFLIGESGSRKSQVVSLLQSFFGPEFWSDKNTPAGWNSTSTSLQDLLIKIKTLCLVDDFTPVETLTAKELAVKAEEVFRSNANGTSKHRSNSAGELQQTPEPGAQILSSGESLDMIFTDSMVKRITFFPIDKHDIDLEKLSIFQEHGKNGVFAQFSSSLIQSTLKSQKSLKDKLLKEFCYFRTMAIKETGGNTHGRLNDNFASLMVALVVLYQFARKHKVITKDEYTECIDRDWLTLKELSIEQEVITTNMNPATILRDSIVTALRQGIIHVCDYKSGLCPNNIQFNTGWENGLPSGEFLGWVNSNSNDIYIPTYTDIKLIKNTIPKNYLNLLDSPKISFWKIIARHNGLTLPNPDRNTVRKINPKTGEKVNVYCLKNVFH